MKVAFTFLALVLAVLAGGCVASSPASTTPALPDLVGTWTGPMIGYDEGSGFSDYPNLTLAMEIEEQRGRLFAGHFLLNSDGREWSIGFAGVVGRDNRSLTIAERDGGYCLGEVVAEDEIELTYMQDGSPYSIAVDYLKRV